jgi:hypothetical protein
VVVVVAVTLVADVVVAVTLVVDELIVVRVAVPVVVSSHMYSA